ncbi:MAG: type II toxin-antitoxin system ParD family antitoxin [Alphaproteobacteria bacterium]|nr:type II toxin-antitoxin system ParD family antitoxin [Alphaproteobacteria bacterium]
MAKNTSVTLGDHFDRFIAGELEKGRYASASEVIRAGLRLLEEHEAKLDRIRQALIEGEESGISEDSDLKRIWAEARAEMNEDEPA